MSLLELDGTTVRYGGVTAVDSVSFTVEPGSLVGLIGPNGAGKTTLIDAVTGMVRCSGDIRLEGRSIASWPAHRRSRAGIVRTFQSLELFMDLTVRENLQTYARPRDGLTAAEVAERALEQMGVGWAADRYPAELSAGSARLVSVARALAAGPRLLLLDEPAAGLDAGESRHFGTRLRSLVDEGAATVLLVDHDVDLIMRICDDVQVLDFGRRIASGPPSSVRDDPEVARAYLGAGTESATGGAS
ncbi:ABC transporter ATP-binding protein [Thermobifida alba]|jgi:branched-chain amino acid transport system ATP-binding protein|uniref:ABC transporter ATP-binding protein n=1 Tax=Thermobifida alba TaxID=53522 RepID=A0ABY4LA73_THEAE|nr:ABC transporter ATP-binding protein [Thermobifida alba]UPT23345.1 ABC transporter ATP-binding protein [Thermobifida alba]HLU98601.1 ABC transporter ATP-binding protein [Thermobifida alba]